VYPVTLVAPTVTLREFKESDVHQVAALVGDDRVTKWLSFNSRSAQEAAAMLAGIIARSRSDPRSEYYLAVAEPMADTLVGFCRLELSGVRAAKLGYAVLADHWNCGYATSAVGEMLRFAFGELDLHRVSAAIGPENKASIAVVQTFGFKNEGRIRDHVFTNGAWRDSLLYSLLAHEWRGSLSPSHANH